MRNPKIMWEANYANVKHMHWLHEQLCSLLPAMDITDILRSEYVLIVSAFDCYVHDVVLEGMGKMFTLSKPSNKHYEDFNIPMSTVKQLMSASDQITRDQIFYASIKRLLSKDSYQSPKSIEYAMGILDVKKIWTEVSKKLGIPLEDVRKKLGIVIQRRNKIAHEADIQDYVTMKKTL